MERSTGSGVVRIVSTHIVRPEPASSPDGSPETVHLAPWDLRILNLEYIQKGILLPKPPPPRTTSGGGDGLVDGLASSLARTLSRFYPLAGRLTATSVVPGGGLAFSIRCSGEGAELVHAVAPDVTVGDIATPLYVPPVVRSLFPFERPVQGVEAVLESRPLVAAQVTELADGVFVAMSLNHGVADGTTFWHLFNTWSEISRSRSGGGDFNDDGLRTPPPVLDRWFPDTASCPVPIPMPYAKVEDMVRRPEHYAPVQECFFHFSAESVRKLKAKANAEMAGTAAISSLQSLLAHAWRAACRARGLAPHLDTACSLVVGCRERVRGVPRDYAGNAVVRAAARSAAGDVLDGGLGRAVWLLNRAVASFDEAKVRDELASWAREPRLAYARLVWNPAYTLAAGSPRFDVYGNDFGWGRPVAVRSGAGNKVNGKVTVYEGRGGGCSMALEVCLAPEVMSRLVADEEFMEAVTVA